MKFRCRIAAVTQTHIGDDPNADDVADARQERCPTYRDRPTFAASVLTCAARTKVMWSPAAGQPLPERRTLIASMALGRMPYAQAA
jgi:hypothetical protein